MLFWFFEQPGSRLTPTTACYLHPAKDVDALGLRANHFLDFKYAGSVYVYYVNILGNSTSSIGHAPQNCEFAFPSGFAQTKKTGSFIGE